MHTRKEFTRALRLQQAGQHCQPLSGAEVAASAGDGAIQWTKMGLRDYQRLLRNFSTGYQATARTNFPGPQDATI